MSFLGEEGVLAVLNADTRGSGALLFAEEVGAFWEVSMPKPLPAIVVRPESYSRIERLPRKPLPKALAP